MDVWEFERLIQAEEAESWQAAIECYQGDLLPAIYEDWILPHRENLRQQYLACLLKLGETHEANQQGIPAWRTINNSCVQTRCGRRPGAA